MVIYVQCGVTQASAVHFCLQKMSHEHVGSQNCIFKRKVCSSPEVQPIVKTFYIQINGRVLVQRLDAVDVLSEDQKTCTCVQPDRRRHTCVQKSRI